MRFRRTRPIPFDSHGAAVSAGRRGRRVPGTSSVLYIDGGAPSGVPPSSSSSSGSPVGYSSRSMRAAKFEARAVGFAGLDNGFQSDVIIRPTPAARPGRLSLCVGP